MSRVSSRLLTIGLALLLCVFVADRVSAQPVFAGIFGAREIEYEVPSAPGVLYKSIIHDLDDSSVYDELEYDPQRGYGYEVLFPDDPTEDRFGPFDNSPNNRSDFAQDLPDLIYNSFIGFKSFAQPCNDLIVGDPDEPCAPTIDADGGIFRVDVPNGSYRFVGVFGDANNPHAHRVLAENGGSGPPVGGAGDHVVLVHNHDQGRYDIGGQDGGDLGEGVFARVGFDDKLPPEPEFDIPGRPEFVNMDENGMSLIDADGLPTDAPPNSPTLNVTAGYIRIHLLQGNSTGGPGGQDGNGGDMVLLEVWPAGAVAPRLQPGDADQDLDFDQLDLVQVQVAAKYLTGQVATWGEGDWDGAPGGEQGMPPAGNALFDQLDIIAALGAGKYLTGPYAALAPAGQGDGNASLVYNPANGEVAVRAGATELTSINIDSASGIFTGDAAQNLGGSFDNDADNNIFKATFGSSFGSLSFGNVAQPGLSEDLVRNDLTVVGSLQGGGALGNVDLVYVPEPSTVVLLGFGLLGLVGYVCRRRLG